MLTAQEGYAYFEGRIIPMGEAKVSVATHALHYGTGYFEGIRCYQLASGRSAVFRLREHMQRLADSGKILGFPLPYSVEQLELATLQPATDNQNLERGRREGDVLCADTEETAHAMDAEGVERVVVFARRLEQDRGVANATGEQADG